MRRAWRYNLVWIGAFAVTCGTGLGLLALHFPPEGAALGSVAALLLSLLVGSHVAEIDLRHDDEDDDLPPKEE